jgi:hypothetical protein
VQELTRNDTFETPSTEAAIPSGGVPLLSKQLRETMEKVQWHPMRVAYDRGDRVLAIRDELKRRGVEHFLPMHWEYTKDELNAHKQLKPAINGLIFIHASRWDITELKKMPGFEALRYWMDKTKGENVEDRVLTVPDAQMQNFMRVAAHEGDNVVYLQYNEQFLDKPGKRVRIKEGDFAGCTGTIRRIKKRQCVVVQIDHVAAMALAFVPPTWLDEI